MYNIKDKVTKIAVGRAWMARSYSRVLNLLSFRIFGHPPVNSCELKVNLEKKRKSVGNIEGGNPLLMLRAN